MERTAEIHSVLWLGTAIMLMLALGLIFLVLFYQNYFSRMKRREAEHLLQVSLESEKSERKRIAADLHDSVSGDLVAIRNYLAIVRKNGDQAIDSSILDELREGVENALQNTRQVSYKLMPPLLDTFGLAAAVKDNFERLSNKTGIDFSIMGDAQPPIPDEIAYELFRIIQEFTTNMLKYGNITKCRVNIAQKQQQIIMQITDDGKVYDFEKQLEQSPGTGLRNIESRLKVIGAVMKQRKTDEGNHFIITLKQKPC